MGWLQAAGTVYSALQQRKASAANAGFLTHEGQLASEGFDQNYASQLRKNAVMMGNATAAAVQSGGGTGGSTKGVLDQSALNASLDALNIRYGGIVRRETYDQQAGIDLSQGRQLATATLLKGLNPGGMRSLYGGSLWTQPQWNLGGGG